MKPKPGRRLNRRQTLTITGIAGAALCGGSAEAILGTKAGRRLFGAAGTPAGKGSVGAWRPGAVAAKQAPPAVSAAAQPSLVSALGPNPGELAAGFAFSPDGRKLVVRYHNLDWFARLWHVADPARPHAHSKFDGAAATAFSPDSRTLATAAQDGAVTLWNISAEATAARLASIPVRRSPGTAVAFSPDGRALLTHLAPDATNTYRIRVWDVTDGRRPAEVTVFATGQGAGLPPRMEFSADGRTLATFNTSFLKLWDLTDPAQPRQLCTVTRTNDRVALFAFNPAGPGLVTADSHGTVTFWDSTDPAHPARVSSFVPVPRLRLTSVAVSPDGRTLATTFPNENVPVRLWDISDPAHPTDGATIPTNYLTVGFSPDNHTLAMVGAGHVVELYQR
jgi:WD40 repeat protein